MTIETKTKIGQYIETRRDKINSKEDIKQICLEAFALFTLSDKEVLDEIIPKLVELKHCVYNDKETGCKTHDCKKGY